MNRKKVLWIIRYIVALLILSAGIFFAISSMYFDSEYDFIKSREEIKPIGFQQGDIIEQSLTFAVDKIHNVGICSVARTDDCAGEIYISLLNENSSLIWQEMIHVESMQIQGITWFDVQQFVEPQQNYKLKISAEKMTGVLYFGSVEAADSSNAANDNAVKNGIELSEPMVVEFSFYTRIDIRMRIIILIWALVATVYMLGFEKLFMNRKRAGITVMLTLDILLVSIFFRAGFKLSETLNYFMFAGLVAAFFVIAVIYLFLLFKKIEKVEIYFAVSTLIFGIVYSIILPPYSMSDEGFHFAQANRLCNAIMGYPINDEQGYIYMRECDIVYREHRPYNEYTIDMIKALIRGDNDRPETMAPSECQRITTAPITMYVFQAIGVTIGRLCHFNYARLIFMARFMNLIMFICAGYWAIKITPYGKWIFYAVCQIPILLETVSSCSYDTPILAGSFMFIAYLLKLCEQKERVSIRQIGKLAIIVFFFAPLKPVYAPLAALVFLLPDKSISDKKWKSRACKIVVVVVALTSVQLTYMYSIGSMICVRDDVVHANTEIVITDDTDVVSSFELESLYQVSNNKPYKWPSIEYMVENPFNLVESFMGSFIVYADEYWMALIGCGLGNLWHWRNPAYVGIITLLLLYISYRKDNGEENFIISLKGRLWSILMMAGSLFGVFLAMYLDYSEPSDKVIGGVQGRYMLPLLVVLPFFLRKGADNNGRTKTSIVMLSLTVQILAVLNIAMQIWNC